MKQTFLLRVFQCWIELKHFSFTGKHYQDCRTKLPLTFLQFLGQVIDSADVARPTCSSFSFCHWNSVVSVKLHPGLVSAMAQMILMNEIKYSTLFISRVGTVLTNSSACTQLFKSNCRGRQSKHVLCCECWRREIIINVDCQRRFKEYLANRKEREIQQEHAIMT